MGGVGFEPTNPEGTDLQSVGFDPDLPTRPNTGDNGENRTHIRGFAIPHLATRTRHLKLSTYRLSSSVNINWLARLDSNQRPLS